jgi:hypothetical protein
MQFYDGLDTISKTTLYKRLGGYSITVLKLLMYLRNNKCINLVWWDIAFRILGCVNLIFFIMAKIR